jgi:hypothetical protein
MALALGLVAGCGDDKGSVASGDAVTPTPVGTPHAAAGPKKHAKPITAAPSTPLPPTEAPSSGVNVKGAGFSIRMPDQPQKVHNEAGSGNLKVLVDLYSASSDTETFGFGRSEYPDYTLVPALSDALSDEADVDEGKVASSRRLTYGGYQAIDGVIVGTKDDDDNPAVIFVRIVLVGRLQFTMTYIAKGSLSQTAPAAFRTYCASLRFN